MRQAEVVIVGGGPAGLAAAIGCYDAGVHDVLVVERDASLGGILNQCIHNGFGLHTFQEELTGPEYAERFIREVKARQIPCLCSTMVLEITPEQDKRLVTILNENGLTVIEAKAVVLAMGCRERPRGALNLPGFRPAGIFSAGTAQHFVNIEGKMPGHRVVILGSGDIGLIMARRLTLEGAKVETVAEVLPYCGGLTRNLVQCLQDYNIPLRLSTTVVDIHGKDRVTGVTLAKVGEDRRPIPGTEEEIPCDTLLLSVGLIPENELSKGAGITLSPVTSGPVVNNALETSLPGVFACGNVLHVHDLVDYVSEEAKTAGIWAARYAMGLRSPEEKERDDAVQTADTQTEKESVSMNPAAEEESAHLNLAAGPGIRYTVPSIVVSDWLAERQKVMFRVQNVYRDVKIVVRYQTKDGTEGTVLSRKKNTVKPGEMEELYLNAAQLRALPDQTTLTVAIEK